MNRKEMEDRIVENYRKDENMMILVFAQWCVNHDLDPVQIYRNAYPDQVKNPALGNALELTVPKEEAGEIGNETVIGVLSMFGNDDLAFEVTRQIEMQKKN
ncbi:hypothetical protein [Alteribacter natronophilus]|uniref:hypothetical protein n=1 Tax=Alteribacter natronophilus TaxID=2583810 RepID=UPI00110EAF73|nr:hypothetical protein [Alteribacter natronophilus]TMW73421.1 hypothetical protein FGB90_03720 [Alteribacter natronophilus]